jgi:O-antigen ligase
VDPPHVDAAAPARPALCRRPADLRVAGRARADAQPGARRRRRERSLSAPRAVRAPTPIVSGPTAPLPLRLPRADAGARAHAPPQELLLVGVGLFICTGLPEAIAPGPFRIAKHAFYLSILAVVLLRWRTSLEVVLRDWVLCAFAALLLVSALWSELPVWAFKRGAVMVQTTAFGLYLASRFSFDEQLRALSAAMGVLLAALAASALLDPAGAFSSPDHPGAFRGPLVHKNHVALLMAVAMPALLLQVRNAPRARWLLLPALASAGVFLALSKSLGGTLVAALLCSLVLLHRRAARRHPLLLLLPVLAVVLGAVAAASGWLDPLLLALGKDPTLTGRKQIWTDSLALLSARPWLGHSLASFWQLEIVARTGVWFSNAHNGYLQLLIDLGLVGLSLFALQLLTSLVRSFSFARRAPVTSVWPWCMTACVLVYNLIEVSVVEENSIVWVLYVAASLAVRSPAPRRPALSA